MRPTTRVWVGMGGMLAADLGTEYFRIPLVRLVAGPTTALLVKRHVAGEVKAGAAGFRGWFDPASYGYFDVASGTPECHVADLPGVYVGL